MLALTKRTAPLEHVPTLNLKMYSYDKEEDCFVLEYPFIDTNNEIGISRNISKNLDKKGYDQTELEAFLTSEPYNLVKLEYMFS